MTRDELAAQVTEDLNNLSYYTAQDYIDSLQDGYSEIAAFTGCIMKAVEIPYVANKSYYDMITLVPDFLAVVAVFSSLRKRWLSPTSFKELNILRYNWETVNADPYCFLPVNFRYMALFPRPSTATGSMYIFYKATAPTLTGSSTPLIPAEYQKVLKKYCIYDLHEQQNEFAKASIYSKDYVEGLAEIKRWVKEQRLPDRIMGLKG